MSCHAESHPAQVKAVFPTVWKNHGRALVQILCYRVVVELHLKVCFALRDYQELLYRARPIMMTDIKTAVPLRHLFYSWPYSHIVGRKKFDQTGDFLH